MKGEKKAYWGSLAEDKRKKEWEKEKQKGQLYRCLDCYRYYRTNPSINEGCPHCDSDNVFYAADIRYKNWRDWRV